MVIVLCAATLGSACVDLTGNQEPEFQIVFQNSSAHSLRALYLKDCDESIFQINLLMGSGPVQPGESWTFYPDGPGCYDMQAENVNGDTMRRDDVQVSGVYTWTIQ